MATDNTIQKARQVGDTRQNKKGQTEVWTEYKPGKFDWRPQKKKKDDTATQGGGQKPTATSTQVQGQKVDATQGIQPKPSISSQPKGFDDMTPDEIVSYAESAATNALEAVVNDKKQNKDIRQIAFNVLRKRDDYDKTKVDSSDLNGGYIPKKQPKIQYQKKKPDIEINVPDTWIIPRTENGKRTKQTVSSSGQRKLYESYDNDQLLKVLNNTRGTWQNRQLAYEEAAARGISEDKIDVSGTLKEKWDNIKDEHDWRESMKSDVNEEDVESIDFDWKGLDHERIMEHFPGGDTGWLNPNDPRVKKLFNLDTLIGRQQYDTFKAYYQTELPGYLDPDDKAGLLNELYEDFVKEDTTPLLVSSGGAGVGKTYGFQKICEYLNVPELKTNDDPNSDDWGYVQISEDPAEADDLNRLLALYNGTYIDEDGEEHGHILFFDDKDRILTTKKKDMMGIMKKILDNNPENRTFINPDTGKEEIFTGRIIVTSNKDMSALSANSEDTKAILDRAMVNDISLTRDETIQVLSKRYKTMGLSNYQRTFERQFPDKKEQERIRNLAFQFLKDNMNDADPAKFSPRAFIRIMPIIGNAIYKSKGGKGGARTVNGIQVGTKIPWQISALNIIKADETINFGKEQYTEEGMVRIKERLNRKKKELKKKNKTAYDRLFGKKALDIILGIDEPESEDDTEKAIMSDFGDMSIDDAKSLLLN